MVNVFGARVPSPALTQMIYLHQVHDLELIIALSKVLEIRTIVPLKNVHRLNIYLVTKSQLHHSTKSIGLTINR